MQMSEPLKQLLILLADGQFHSGTQLAQKLGVSRSAIWKQLQALNTFGIAFSAVSGKGYKLPQPLQLLDKQLISRLLQPQLASLIHQLEIHDSIASTNQYLLDNARKQLNSGVVCLAEYQTAGKGRRGRQWVSPFGQNIYLSILWHYQDGPSALAGLSLALGVAVIKALQQLGISDCGLKWPNDILRQQRKLGGILVEISGETGGPCHAVIGLGLNFYLSQQQAEIITQPWTDISTALGTQAYSRRNELIALLLNQLMPLLADYSSAYIQQYVDEWRKFDAMLGKTVTIYIGEQTYQGMIMGINDEGLLILKTIDGQLRHFASGEVSFSQS